MIIPRPAAERGQFDHGWLKTAHSFSFASYYDPAHMGFGPLRVINEDHIAAGAGFGKHGHRDMEIISVVLAGALAHEDSMGNRATIVPGEVQRMSAGSGVLHSEYNHARGSQTHLLQIWIEPDRTGGAPSYEQRSFAAAAKRGRLCLLVSPDGADGSLTMQQNARLYGGLFNGTESADLALAPSRLGYLHVARGELIANGRQLRSGDALKYVDEPAIEITAGVDAEVLVFDLPT